MQRRIALRTALILRQIRTLEGVVEREAVPKDEPHLVGLTKAS